MERSDDEAVNVEDELEAEDRGRLLPREDNEWALGGRLIVLASMILEAWKFDNEPIENQLELETPDLWLTLDRPDVTERPDSELIEDKAEDIEYEDCDWAKLGCLWFFVGLLWCNISSVSEVAHNE